MWSNANAYAAAEWRRLGCSRPCLFLCVGGSPVNCQVSLLHGRARRLFNVQSCITRMRIQLPASQTDRKTGFAKNPSIARKITFPHGDQRVPGRQGGRTPPGTGHSRTSQSGRHLPRPQTSSRECTSDNTRDASPPRFVTGPAFIQAQSETCTGYSRDISGYLPSHPYHRYNLRPARRYVKESIWVAHVRVKPLQAPAPVQRSGITLLCSTRQIPTPEALTPPLLTHSPRRAGIIYLSYRGLHYLVFATLQLPWVQALLNGIL